jgi:GT2 family glycosyltransferase
MRTELSIVIVNWNGLAFLPDCLKSIIDNPPVMSWEIVVVDNDSSDGSVEWLQSANARSLLKGAKFTLIQSGANLGFSRANNIAIERTDSPFVFILNPDTMVRAGALDNLLATLHTDANIGLTVPKIFDLDRNIQPSVWPVPNAMRSLVDGLGIYRVLPSRLRGDWLLFNHWSYDSRKTVPLASGCAMMAKREMINDVGGFDRDIFMYGEDMEWCYRMGKRGWAIVFEPQAEVIHRGGQSSKQRWTLIESRIKEEQGWIGFQQKCLSPFSVLATSAAQLFVISMRYVVRKMRGKDTEFFDKLLPLYSAAAGSAFLRLKGKLARPPRR